jgi:hypothetical protein
MMNEKLWCTKIHRKYFAYSFLRQVNVITECAKKRSDTKVRVTIELVKESCRHVVLRKTKRKIQTK